MRITITTTEGQTGTDYPLIGVKKISLIKGSAFVEFEDGARRWYAKVMAILIH